MPELKGRTLEEIDELFVSKVPAWKFKTYQTTIQDEALAEVREREHEQQQQGEEKTSNREDGVEHVE